MRPLLTEVERKTIADTIAEVEKGTAGEIVVHVVSASSRYAAVRAFGAALTAYAIVQVAALLVSDEDAPWAMLGFLPLFVATFFLAGIPAILRHLVPPALKTREVHRRAAEAFLTNRVHRTRDASGVLILVSVFERRVQILADEGIHQHVGVEGWSGHVSLIVDAIRAGRAGEGLVKAIRQIGQELAARFPPRPDDENELPNEVVMTPR